MELPIPKLDPDKNLGKWVIFPDNLPSGLFRGFQNKYDDSRNIGTFSIGENIVFDVNSNPTPRPGSEVLGSEAANSTPIKRAWTFETRDGYQYTLRTYDTKLEYFLHGVSTDFSLLKGGFTSGLEFGYGDIGKTVDDTAHTIFCNGTDGWYRFNGAFATVASVTVNTITKSGSSTWSSIGFYSTGTRSFIANGQEFTYSGGEGTTTITGVSPDPSAAGITTGNLVVQSPQLVSSLASFKGQVTMAHDGRLHARLETKKSVWNYSKLDDPFDWTAGSNDGDGGAKEVEFGGPIVAFAKLNEKALCFKKRLIKSLTFEQFGSRVDAPRYGTFTPADDKSTNIGATNQKSTISTPFGVFFVTPDKRAVILTGVTQNFQPQYVFLSDPIEPIFTQGLHNDATAIYVNNYLYYSFKSSPNSTFNDTVIRCDMSSFSLNGRFIWSTPFVGWNVSDWNTIFNDETGKYDVLFHSSLNSSTYRVVDDKTDNNAAFTTTLRTHGEMFGSQNKQKRIGGGFVEIRMPEQAEILTTLLYDEDGVTSRTEYLLRGNMSEYSFNKSSYNPFGSSPFGSQKIGSNAENNGYNTYRFELEVDPNIRFFKIFLQLSADGENFDYELVRYGYLLEEVIKETDNQFKLAPSA